MTFNPNTDANWANYLAAVGAIPAQYRFFFDQALIQWLCTQITASGTINAGTFANALVLAKQIANTDGVNSGQF